MTAVDSPQGPDLVGVALASLAAGAAAGAGVVSAALVLFHGILDEVLPLTVFAGIVTASVVAWLLAAPVTDTWRRGVTAALAVFGALMLAGLAAPADMVGGRLGVGGYAVALTLGALWAGRRARLAARR